MSEFENNDEAHQAAIQALSEISALHAVGDHRCNGCGFAWPCKTVRIIQDYKKKFFTKQDAVLDAIYLSYPASDLAGRDLEIGALANRIVEVWPELLASARTVPTLAGMMFWISLDDTKAFQAALAIEAKVLQVRS